MKMNLVELLKERGFAEVENKDKILRESGVTLELSWEDKRWTGSGNSCAMRATRYTIRVFVNVNSRTCHVCFPDGDWRPYGDHLYKTIGKRTYNAIAETVRFAGYEM